MEFFDSHVHYNDDLFDKDREEIISQTFKEGITKIIVAGCDICTTKSAIQLSKDYNFIYATAGLHPQYAEDIDNSINELKLLSRNPKVVAIGEIGLDYHWNSENKEIQKEAFRKQIIMANEENLPIVIHSRDAYLDTLEILKKDVFPVKKGVFHCCQLNIELVKEALKLGFNISFAGPITFKNSKNADEIIKLIPLEKLQIETDAPYLSPEPFRGTRNNSINVKLIAEKIAKVKGLTLDEVAKATYQNTIRLFDKIKNPY